MNYNTVKEARELAGWSAESEALSVYQAVEKLTDKRRAQGKRYSLALLLTCVLLAKLELIQAHWSIENRLHWRRDVTMAEDARSGFARGWLLTCSPFSIPLSWLSLISVG